MKKLIAVLVALAMAAGSAFAETNVNWGGVIWSSGAIAHGGNADDDEVRAGGLHGEVRLSASITTQTNIGTFGGFGQVAGLLGVFRGTPVPGLTGDDVGPIQPAANAVRMWGNVWWQSGGLVDLRMQMGTWIFQLNDLHSQTPAVRLGTSHATRELQHRQSAISWFDPFMLELVDHGFAIDATLLDGMVRVGVGLPNNAWNWTNTFMPGTTGVNNGNGLLEDALPQIVTRVRVDLPGGMGRVGIGYSGLNNHSGRGVGRVNGSGNNTWGGSDHGDIYAYFHTNMLPLISLDVGARLGLVEDAQDMSMGVRVGFNSGNGFGVNLRGTFGMGFGEQWDNQGNATAVNVELFPWIDLTENVGLAMTSGFGMNIGGSDFAGDPLVMWLVNPYVIVSLSGPRMVAGFRIHGNNNRGEDTTARTMGWEIPIGFQLAW